MQADPSAISRAKWQGRLAPSLGTTLWTVLFVVNSLPAVATRLISDDGDFALHVLLGKLMWKQGGLLATEPTNFVAAGKPFIAHEWGTQLLFGGLYQAFGLAGPVFLCSALFATTAWLIWWKCRREGAGPWPAGLSVGVGLGLAHVHLLARPHLVSWLLGLLWFVMLDEVVKERWSWRRWYTIAVPIQIVWTNLHGGFMLSFVVLGSFFLAGLIATARTPTARSRTMALQIGLAGIVCVLASGANPFLFDLHAHILGFVRSDYLMRVTPEFAPLALASRTGITFLTASATMAALALFGRRFVSLPGALLLLLFFVWMLKSARQGAFLALFAPVVLAPIIQRLLESGRGLATRIQAANLRLAAFDSQLDGRLGASVVIVLVIVLVGILKSPAIEFDRQAMPVAAADQVLSHPEAHRGRMFNTFHWGGYLALRFFPRHLVFMNGFIDHLGEALTRRYQTVHMAQEEQHGQNGQDGQNGWRQVLNDENIQWAIVDPATPIAAALQREPGWSMVHRDETAAIFSRYRGASSTSQSSSR